MHLDYIRSKKIEAKIGEMGLRNSLGNPIKANQVDFILNNPFYYGEMKVKGQLYAHNSPPFSDSSSL